MYPTRKTPVQQSLQQEQRAAQDADSEAAYQDLVAQEQKAQKDSAAAAEQAKKDAATAAKRQIEHARRAGVEIEKDSTGNERIRRHEDKKPYFTPGFQGRGQKEKSFRYRDPRGRHFDVPAHSIRREEDKTGGYNYAFELDGRTVTQPEDSSNPLFKTDETTGERFVEDTDPETGSVQRTGVGFDRGVATQVALTKADERYATRKAELAEQSAALRAQRDIDTVTLEPITDKLKQAKDALDDLARGKQYEERDGGLFQIDDDYEYQVNDDSDKAKALAWIDAKKQTEAQIKAIEGEHAPLAEKIHAAELEEKKIAQQILEEGHRTRLAKAEIERQSKAGAPVWEPEFQTRIAEAFKDRKLSDVMVEGELADEGHPAQGLTSPEAFSAIASAVDYLGGVQLQSRTADGSTIGDAIGFPQRNTAAEAAGFDVSLMEQRTAPFAEFLAQAPQTPKGPDGEPDVTAAAKAFGIKNPEQYALVAGQGDSHELVNRSTNETIAYLDGESNRLKVPKLELLGERGADLINNADESTAPVFAQSGRPFDARERRDYFQSAFDARLTDDDAAIAEVGADLNGIRKRFHDGSISAQDAKYLLKTLHGVESKTLHPRQANMDLLNYVNGSEVESGLWKGPNSTPESRAAVIDRFMDGYAHAAQGSLLYSGARLSLLRDELKQLNISKGKVAKAWDWTKDTGTMLAGSMAGLGLNAAELMREHRLDIVPGLKDSDRYQLFKKNTVEWMSNAAGFARRALADEDLQSSISDLQAFLDNAEPGEAVPESIAEQLAETAYTVFHGLSDDEAAKRDTTRDTFNVLKDPTLSGYLAQYIETRNPQAWQGLTSLLTLDAQSRVLADETQKFVSRSRVADASDVQERAEQAGISLTDGQALAMLQASKLDDPRRQQHALSRLSGLTGLSKGDTALAISLFTGDESIDPTSFYGYVRSAAQAGAQELALEAASTAVSAGTAKLVAKGLRAAAMPTTVRTTRRAAIGGWMARNAAQAAKDFDELLTFKAKFGKPLTKTQRAANAATTAAKGGVANAASEAVEEGAVAVGEAGSTLSAVGESALQGAMAGPLMSVGMTAIAMPFEIRKAFAEDARWEQKKGKILDDLNKTLSTIPGATTLNRSEFEQALLLYGSPQAQAATSEITEARSVLEQAHADVVRLFEGSDTGVGVADEGYAKPDTEGVDTSRRPDQPPPIPAPVADIAETGPSGEPVPVAEVAPTPLSQAQGRVIEARDRLAEAIASAKAREALAVTAQLELREMPEEQRTLYTAAAKAASGVREFTQEEATALKRLTGGSQVRFVPAPNSNAPSAGTDGPAVSQGPRGRMILQGDSIPLVPDSLLADVAERAPSLHELVATGGSRAIADQQAETSQESDAEAPQEADPVSEDPSESDAPSEQEGSAESDVSSEQREKVRRVVDRVLRPILKKSPKLAERVTVEDSDLGAGLSGFRTGSDGKIHVYLPTLARDLAASGVTGTQAPKRVAAMLDEEIRHAANMDAARELWQEHMQRPDQMQIEFETWRGAYYGDIWDNHFTPEQRAAVEEAYGTTLPEEKWVRAFEGLRMLSQVGSAEFGTITEAILRHLNAVVQVLKDMLAEATPAIRQEIKNIERILREYGYADYKQQTVRGRPAREPETLDEKAHEAATSPTNSQPEPSEGQKEAGNYKKGHIKVGGLEITVENPAGSKRRGTSKDGTTWETEMKSHYGDIPGTKSKDGDPIDIFVKEGTQEDYEGPVFVVNQMNSDGEFDEHKAVVGEGITTQKQAKAEYLKNYEDGWDGAGTIVKFDSIDAFKAWAKERQRRAPAKSSAPKAPKKKVAASKPTKYTSAQEELRQAMAGLFAAPSAPSDWRMVETGSQENDGISPSSVLQFEHVARDETPQHILTALDGLATAWRQDAGATGATSPFTSSRLQTPASGRGRSIASFIQGFERVTGKQVVWVDTSTDLPIPWRAATSPSRPNTIFVHQRAVGNVLALVGHEWGHTLEAQDPTLYRQLQRELARYISKADAKAMRRRLSGISGYRREILSTEITNNIIGDLFTDQAFWRDVEARDTGLLRQLIQSVMGWFDSITEGLRGSEWGTENRLQDVAAARKAVADTFAEAVERGPYSELSSGNDGELVLATEAVTEPIEQRAIPPERMEAVLKAAQAMIEAEVKTPEALATFLSDTFPDGKAQSYSQALWNALSVVDPALTGQHNWQEVYAPEIQKNEPLANEPDSSDNQQDDLPASQRVERDQRDAESADRSGSTGIQPGPGSTDPDGGPVDGAGEGSRDSGGRGASPADLPSALGGSTGDPVVLRSESGTEESASRGEQPEGSSGPDAVGVAVERRGYESSGTAIDVPASRGSVGQSGSVGVEAIRASASSLTDEQAGDVAFIEARLENHPGVLITNGTGTGKTFTGLGAVKRMLDAGAKHILILAPSDKIGSDWVKTAKRFFDTEDIRQLRDTQDAGEGSRVVVGTYANAGINNALVSRPWDAVVTDEAHYLSQSKGGNATNALDAVRALTMHRDGVYKRSRMEHPDWYAEIDQIRDTLEGNRKIASNPDTMDQMVADLAKENEELESRLNELGNLTVEHQQGIQEESKRLGRAGRPKVLMLSATPFAHHFSLDLGEGYLFDFPEEKRETIGRYNHASPRSRFYMENLGYRMRYGKLTQPENATATGILERRLAERFMKEGAMRGRTLQVDKDYGRHFVVTESALGSKLDEIMGALHEPRFSVLNEFIGLGDYLERRYLLEALKAQESVDRIQKHLELGRKVVVFHDYKKGGAVNPLSEANVPNVATDVWINGQFERVNPREVYHELASTIPGFRDAVRSMNSLLSPIDLLSAEFPTMGIFNGSVPKAKRRRIVEEFNRSGSDMNVILVQRASGKEGISLHDVDGKHQRVFMELGIPGRPTDAIQSEGRIYRHGVVSNAPMEYLTTGTSWERHTFAQTIARRASTAENLAMGEQARALLQSFSTGYNDAETMEPGPNQGTGGKQKDAASLNADPFRDAVALYYTNEKKTGRNRAREGVDYYATPEPLGLKMVEWAGVRPGEKVLEPSAGHGAIARFFPDAVNRHAVEPSEELGGRLALNATDVQIHPIRFEDYHIGNKFDAIVMNPPFGRAGKTAMDHLEKAAGHLRNGGRIVALIPEGAMDKRLNDWLDSESAENIYLTAQYGLPQVAFTRAGTSVKARVVVLDKTDAPGSLPPSRGRRDFNGDTVEDFFEAIKNSTSPDRVEIAEPDPSAEPGQPELDAPAESMIPKPSTSEPNTFEPAEAWHAKKDKAVYVARIARRLERPDYLAAKTLAKKHGGYYSAYTRNGAIPGFQFEEVEQRDAFLGEFDGGNARLAALDAAPGPNPRRILRNLHKVEEKRQLNEKEKEAYERALRDLAEIQPTLRLPLMESERLWRFIDGEPIATVKPGSIRARKGEPSATAAAVRWLQENPIKDTTRPDLGTVKVGKSGLKSSLSHGFSGPKLNAISAVPAVLEHGALIDVSPDDTNPEIENALLVAPVSFDGTRRLLFVRVKRDAKKGALHGFYLHEIRLTDTVKREALDSIKTGTYTREGIQLTSGIKRMINVLARQLRVNGKLEPGPKEVAGPRRDAPLQALDAAPAATQEALETALGSMPAIWRDALERTMNGAAIEDVAKALRLSETAVGNLLKVAQKRLQFLLRAGKGNLEPAVQVEDNRIKASEGRPDLGMGAIPHFAAVDAKRATPTEVTHAEMNELAGSMIDAYPDAAERMVTRWMDQGILATETDSLPKGLRSMVESARARQAGEMLMTAAAKLLVSKKALEGGDPIQAARLIDAYRNTGTEQARALGMRYDPHQTPEERSAMFISEALLTPTQSHKDAIRKNPDNKDRILAQWAVQAQQLKKDLLAQGYDIDLTFKMFHEEQMAAKAVIPKPVRLPLAQAARNTKVLVRSILEGDTPNQAAVKAGIDLGKARELYAAFREKVNKAGQEAAQAMKDQLLGAAPADFASSVGLPFADIFDAPDRSPVDTDATRRLRGVRQQPRPSTALDLDDPVSVARAVNTISTRKSTRFDRISEYWRASILSGPQTHVVNTVSGIGYGAYELTVKKLGKAVLGDTARALGMTSDAESLRDLPAMLSAIVPAVKSAFRDSIRAWKAEARFFDAYALDDALSNHIGGMKADQFSPALRGKLGKFMRGISFRLMLLADEFMKSFVTRVEVAGQARQIARAEGLKGLPMAERMEQLMVPGSLAWVRGLDLAKKITFQTDLNVGEGTVDALDGLANMVNNAKKGDHGKFVQMGSHFLFPFVSTPTNIFKTGMTMTPLGGLLAIVDAARSLNQHRKGNKDQARQIYNAARALDDMVNQVVVWGVMYALSDLIEIDEDDPDSLPLITGSSPWEAGRSGVRDNENQTAPPQSIWLAGQYRSYRRLDPFATVLSSIVDGMLAFRSGVPYDEAIGQTGVQILSGMRDKTFFSGLGDFMNTMQDPARYGPRWATNIGTGFIPNLIRQTLRSRDPFYREYDLPNDLPLPEVIYRRVKYGIDPTTNPLPRFTAWGEPVTKKTGMGGPTTDFLYRLFSPIATQDISDVDPLEIAIRRWNILNPDDEINVQAPSREIERTIEGEKVRVSLSDEEYEAFVRRGGKRAREMVGPRFNRGIPDERAADWIRSAHKKAMSAERSKAFSTAFQRQKAAG